MKILTRYILLRFLGPFAYGMGAFSLIVFLGHVFDKMNKIATSQAPAWAIAQYLALQMPYWGIRIVPMATLLATLFCVTSFVASGEFVGVQAAGVRSRDLFRPMLWASLGIGLLSFVAQETLLPACYRRSQQLWQEKIHPVWEWDKYFERVLVLGPERFVTTTLFTVKAGTMERPVMDYYAKGRLEREIDALSARWDAAKSLWVFEKGVERRFGEDGAVVAERPFDAWDSDIDVPPKKLVPRMKEDDEMSLREARVYRRRLAQLGQSTRAVSVAMQSKVAFPFANLILCAIGIPIALRLRRSNRAISFATALVVSFLYLWVIEMGHALGGTGALPPLAAAWLPNAVFGCGAFWLYSRAEI